MIPRRVIAFLGVFLPSLATVGLGQAHPDGRWEGTIEVAGLEIPMTVQFRWSESVVTGSIDIQGALGLPLSNVSVEAQAVHFELETAIGLAIWDGEVNGDEVNGTFAQGGATGTFALYPAGGPAAAPDEPISIGSEEVRFTNGDIRLAGTLTLPPTGGPHAAVILITGSGPQNRDEELFGFKPFRIIAEYLTASGLAVLRYDDRGVGGSTGNTTEATTEDFAADVRAAIAFLRSRDDIKPASIGLLGHSEGGIVAPMVAATDNSVAFLVLLAGTGVPGSDVLVRQAELIARVGGAPEDQVRGQRASQEAIFEAVRTGVGWAEVEEQLRTQVRMGVQAMPAAQRQGIADTDAFVDANVRMQLQFSRSPWFTFFLDYDPAVALEQVKSPVLVLFGELDLQVPPEQNRQPILDALGRAGNTDVTEQTFPGANHLFLLAETGSPAEYATLDKTFVDGFLERVASWIRARTLVGRP